MVDNMACRSDSFILPNDCKRGRPPTCKKNMIVRWCVWKVGEGFPDWVLPKTVKWVIVYSSVTFHING